MTIEVKSKGKLLMFSWVCQHPWLLLSCILYLRIYPKAHTLAFLVIISLLLFILLLPKYICLIIIVV